MIPEITRIPPPCEPPSPLRELDFPLWESGSLRLGCLVSFGTPSPPGFWYDQPDAEWVMLLRGNATLRFEEGDLELVAGDSFVIPPHLRHRVEQVSGDAVWLALHHLGKETGDSGQEPGHSSSPPRSPP